ncbi:MAG TPA: DUF4389 domain-containing protein [Gaiellales bacterium]|jgi:Domain of unknown function (DUF4389)|nr:DUF4389 domain-containing protein [Gaiellales bacterium]
MDDYPVRFSVDYPDRPLSRLSSALRVFWIIPILVIALLLEHTDVSASDQVGRHWFQLSSGGGLLILPVVLMLLFRQKYPRWWFDWNLEFSRFTSRLTVYWLLMDDTYPSTDDHQSVHLDFPEVAGPELNRWLPLVKWFLAIPHYIVLFFLAIAAFFVVLFVWFAILFTGRYPRGAFEFVEGVLRWGNRVGGYAFALVTDRYPPFSLSP